MKEPVLDAFRAAASDRRHGASEIELELIDRLLGARSGWRADHFAAGFALLVEKHSGMANLVSLAEELGADMDLEEVESTLVARKEVLGTLPQVLARKAAPFFENCERVVTVSRSSAAAAVVEGLVERGWSGQVIVLDGSKTGRGVDQAACLQRLAAEIRSQPDATAPTWLEGQAETIKVLVGADAISDTHLVNAVGTLLLFELAAKRGIDRIVVADSAKRIGGASFERLLSNMETVSEPGPGRSWVPLERVPTDLISFWVSERGVLTGFPWDWSGQ